MEKYKAPALAKGLDIIDLIRDQGPMSFNELQNATLDNSASLSRYIHTLIAKDYITKNDHQKYALGTKLMDLNSTKDIWPILIHHCKPLMERIHVTYKSTVLLLAYTNDYYKVIDKCVAENNLGMMAKDTLRLNRMNTLWSRQFFQPALDVSKEGKLMEDGPICFEPDSLYHSTTELGYMRHHDTINNVLRYNFPIRINKKIIASIGLGSFLPVLASVDEATMTASILESIKQIEEALH